MQHWRLEADLRVEAVEVMAHLAGLRSLDLQSHVDDIDDLVVTSVRLW